MLSGELRRSSRISELDAQKAMRTKNQNRGRNSSNSKSRKKAKIKPVKDLVLNKVENQVEKADTQSYYEHISAVTTLSRTPLPEKGKLEILLRVLQRRDSNKYFAQPVDPKKVKFYDEVIKEPMDFGTITKKLDEGRYDVLEEFEKDVLLISRNATFFNGPETVYYEEGLAIEQLAKELFHVLRTHPENFEAKFSKERSGPGRRTKGEVEFSNSKSFNKGTVTETSKAPIYQRRFEYYQQEQDKASSSSLSMESVVSTVFGDSKALHLNYENGIGYVRSIMRFAKDLGPMAQKVAIQMARRSIPEDLKNKNVTSSRQFQAPTNHIPSLFLAESGKELVPPQNFSEKFTGSAGHMHGDTLNGELASAGSSMSRHHASVGGIANAIEKRDTLDAFRQTNVQTGSWWSERGIGFENDAINQKPGFQFLNFPVDYSQVGSSSLFTARKSNSIPNKVLFSNMKQTAVEEDKPVQTAKVAFPKPTMQEFFSTRNVGASAYSAKPAPQLSGREGFSAMHSAGSQYLTSKMPHVQAATDGRYQGFRSYLEQKGQVLSGLRPPMQGQHYVQALTDGGGLTLNQGGHQLRNSFELTMLGRGTTDGEVNMINNGGNLEKGGRDWYYQSKPTLLGTPHQPNSNKQPAVAGWYNSSSTGGFQQKSGQVYKRFQYAEQESPLFKR